MVNSPLMQGSQASMGETLLLSRRSAAALLSISLRTLDSLVGRHELSTRRIGRRVLFERRILAQFARRDHATRPNCQGGER